MKKTIESIHAEFNVYFMYKRYDIADRKLLELKVDDVPAEHLIAYIVTTLAASTKLKNRAEFVTNARISLMMRPCWSDDLLEGID